MMTKHSLSNFACASGSVCHVERGLGPAVTMDARSMNVALDYKRIVRDRTHAS